ncbi:hypothetical protein, partial [Falsibacillus pallidus]|uniref:hypothetical protein n=1 Tax=Falsibacillus pallidus TaxID=493781 RepID=UPI001B87788F
HSHQVNHFSGFSKRLSGNPLAFRGRTGKPPRFAVGSRQPVFPQESRRFPLNQLKFGLMIRMAKPLRFLPTTNKPRQNLGLHFM